jgi:hypothetical protein
VSWILQTIANQSFMLFIQSKTLMREHFTDVVQGNFIAKEELTHTAAFLSENIGEPPKKTLKAIKSSSIC